MRSLLFSVLCFLTLAACDKQGNVDPTIETNCGHEEDWGVSMGMLQHSEVNGFKRTLFFGVLSEPENICSEEHVKPVFTVVPARNSDLLEDVKFTASAQVPGYQPRLAPMVYDAAKGEYRAEIEVGLQQAYKDKPASITMFILAEVPSQGYFEVDSALLRPRIGLMNVNMDYKVHVN